VVWKGSSKRRSTKKRYLVLSLLLLTLIFLMLFWRRLGLNIFFWEWLFVESPASPILETVLDSGHAALNCRRRPPLAPALFSYCGPQNGDDFSRAPSDVLDTICAQHDYCIEKSRYYVEGRYRVLYPMGSVDDGDGFLRCGIPVRSHTNPHFGCQISACDREMIASLEHGFQCSDSPLLPKSPWCNDTRVLGQRHCEEYRYLLIQRRRAIGCVRCSRGRGLVLNDETGSASLLKLKLAPGTPSLAILSLY